MNRPSHHSILAQPLGFWVANCDQQAKPDIVKCNGVLFPETLDQLTFFISSKFSERFRSNLQPGRQISFMGCSVYTFESYQYKGEFISIRDCSPEEEVLQRNYVDAFTDTLENIGFPKDGFVSAYFHLPSHAVTMAVRDIFEQTPYKGTGNIISSKGGLV